MNEDGPVHISIPTLYDISAKLEVMLMCGDIDTLDLARRLYDLVQCLEEKERITRGHKR